MALPTNLAPRPFRNERLPWLVAGAVVVLAVLTSVAHVQWISRLISGGEARTVRLVLEDEARIAELETALALEPPLKLEAAEIARLGAFKQLVDRRVFPWRRLLAEFEDLLAADVRLTRISPMAGERGQGMLITGSPEFTEN